MRLFSRGRDAAAAAVAAIAVKMWTEKSIVFMACFERITKCL